MAKSKKTAPEAITKEATAATAAPVASEQTDEVAPVQLTINDLQLLARIVDLASRRGAFQAPELTQVGEAYDKLAGFLAYIESVQAAAAPEESAAE